MKNVAGNFLAIAFWTDGELRPLVDLFEQKPWNYWDIAVQSPVLVNETAPTPFKPKRIEDAGR